MASPEGKNLKILEISMGGGPVLGDSPSIPQDNLAHSYTEVLSNYIDKVNVLFDLLENIDSSQSPKTTQHISPSPTKDINRFGAPIGTEGRLLNAIGETAGDIIKGTAHITDQFVPPVVHGITEGISNWLFPDKDKPYQPQGPYPPGGYQQPDSQGPVPPGGYQQPDSQGPHPPDAYQEPYSQGPYPPDAYQEPYTNLPDGSQQPYSQGTNLPDLYQLPYSQGADPPDAYQQPYSQDKYHPFLPPGYPELVSPYPTMSERQKSPSPTKDINRSGGPSATQGKILNAIGESTGDVIKGTAYVTDQFIPPVVHGVAGDIADWLFPEKEKPQAYPYPVYVQPPYPPPGYPYPPTGYPYPPTGYEQPCGYSSPCRTRSKMPPNSSQQKSPSPTKAINKADAPSATKGRIIDAIGETTGDIIKETAYITDQLMPPVVHGITEGISNWLFPDKDKPYQPQGPYPPDPYQQPYYPGQYYPPDSPYPTRSEPQKSPSPSRSTPVRLDQASSPGNQKCRDDVQDTLKYIDTCLDKILNKLH